MLTSTVSSFTTTSVLVCSGYSPVRSHEGPRNQLLDFNCFEVHLRDDNQLDYL